MPRKPPPQQDDEQKTNKTNFDRIQDQISDLKQIIISNQAGITKIIQGINTMSQRVQIVETQLKNVHGTTNVLPHLDRKMAEMRNYLQNLKGSTEK